MLNENNLQKLFEEFLKENRFSSRLSSETIRGYKAAFDLFITLMPEVEDVQFLTKEMLNEFFQRLQLRERKVGKNQLKSGVKDSTIKTYWSKLNTFFVWLFHRQFIRENPLSRIKPPPQHFVDSRAIEPDSIRKLYASIVLHSRTPLLFKRDTAMISLLLFCGLRLGEFISLEVRDIDFENQLLTVRSTTSKSRRSRCIPIHPTLLFHLKEYIRERNKRKYTSAYLIVSTIKDEQLTRHGLKHWTKNLAKKSGVRFHLHQFRHSFACNLAKKDVNAVKIQKLLGHSSLNMTMTYLRSIGTEDLREDINRLSI